MKKQIKTLFSLPFLGRENIYIFHTTLEGRLMNLYFSIPSDSEQRNTLYFHDRFGGRGNKYFFLTTPEVG